MTFKTQVTLKDYTQFSFSVFYKKPLMIFITAVGIGNFIVLILSISGIKGTSATVDNTIMRIILSLLVLWLPFSVYRTSKKYYHSHQRLHEEIEYDFTDEKMKTTGSSFNSELDWSKTYKIEEIKKFFLIYESNLIAILIPKKDMTLEETTSLRTFFRNLDAVKVKKLRK